MKFSLLTCKVGIAMAAVGSAFLFVACSRSSDDECELHKCGIVEFAADAPQFGSFTRYCDDQPSTRYNLEGQCYVQKRSGLPGKARIMCGGDLMCEPVMSKAVYRNGKFFFESCFSGMRKLFKASDFAIANLETCVDPELPYAMDVHKLPDRYHCNAPVEYLRALRYMGLDAVTMANNHSADCGARGILRTIQNVDRVGLMHTGTFVKQAAPRFLIVDINGIKVVFLSYTQHINSKLDKKCFTRVGRDTMLNLYTKEKLQRDLGCAKKAGAEFSICYIHFNCKEYTHEESEFQRESAREIAESGVNCVVGNHAHAVQRYDNIITTDGRCVPVVYSLGNFITSDYHKTTRTSYVYELFLAKAADGSVIIENEKYIPCRVVESLMKSAYSVWPTPAKWRNGVENELLQQAEMMVRNVVGEKIAIDVGE